MTQSNEPTIEQMNEAIALFDNWEPNYGGEGSPFYSKKTEFIPRFAMIVDMQYHTSWDWLMPVVLKAKALYLNFDTGGMRDKLNMRYKAIENELRNLSLLNTHYCLYRFIAWYNDNQQKQTNEGKPE